MSTRSTTPAFVLAALALGGCLPARQIGHFSSNGFYHAREHYRVRYVDGAEQLLSESWTLENFDHDEEGEPTFARTAPSDVYFDNYLMSQFAPVRREYGFLGERIDLRYRRNDGVGEIYARTLPLPPGWARAGLGTVMRRAVVAMTVPMSSAPDLLGHQVPTGTVVHLRGEGVARVDGRRGHYVTFDLIQSNRESGEERVRRVSLVGVRPDRHVFRVRRWRLPMLVVFGLISSPEEHEAQRAELESFVSRVDFAEPSG